MVRKLCALTLVTTSCAFAQEAKTYLLFDGGKSRKAGEVYDCVVKGVSKNGKATILSVGEEPFDVDLQRNYDIKLRYFYQEGGVFEMAPLQYKSVSNRTGKLTEYNYDFKKLKVKFFRVQDALVHGEVVDKALMKEEAAELFDYIVHMQCADWDRQVLGVKPRKVGEEWEMNQQYFKLGSSKGRWQYSDGKGTVKLDKVEQRGESVVATVSSIFSYKLTFLKPVNYVMNMKGTMTMERDLSKQLTTRIVHEYDTKVTMEGNNVTVLEHLPTTEVMTFTPVQPKK